MRFCFQGIPDLFRKGRGYVNIFLEEKTYLGEVDCQEFQAPLAGFLGLARAIRGKLGNRQYLLDRYLLDLLELTQGFFLMDVVQEGNNTAAYLRTACRRAVRGENAAQETPVRRQIQAFVKAHPHPFFEDYTKVELCRSELSDQYLKQAAAQYREDFAACRLGTYDAVKTNGLYQAIVRLAGEEKSMQRLNALFVQKFLRVKPMDLFVQGYMEDLCSALAYRDLQTDHTVLQLLLDQEVE